MRLVIVSGQPHYQRGGVILGLPPVTREIDCLAAMFDEVRHVALLHNGDAPASALPYASGNIRLVPLEPSGGPRLRDKAGVLFRSPSYLKTMAAQLDWADLVHVRCPSSASLMAAFLLALWPAKKPSWVKYAGDWKPRGGEHWSFRLQRMLLSRGLPNGVVSVNGSWASQPLHVHSMLNPSLTAEEVRQAIAASSQKGLELPVRLLFAGRLNHHKGAIRALRILAGLADRGIETRLDFAGDGPQRESLLRLAADAQLTEKVFLHGWLPQQELHDLYTQAHFVVLPSLGEGWPKVLSEGMAFGAVPLSSDVSCIPQVFERIGAGVALPALHVDAFVDAVQNFVAHPAVWTQHRDKGHAAAHLFSFEEYVKRVHALLGLPSVEAALATAAAR